jgi:hypothetical protein
MATKVSFHPSPAIIFDPSYKSNSWKPVGTQTITKISKMMSKKAVKLSRLTANRAKKEKTEDKKQSIRPRCSIFWR